MGRKSKYTEEERKLKEKEKFKRYRENHKAKILEKERLFRINNPDKVKAKQKKYLEDNPERAKENRKVWTENNIERVKEQNRVNSLKNRPKSNARRRYRRKHDPIYKAKCDQWSKDNLDRRRFSGAKRRASKLNATPSWLTENDWMEIRRYYKVASFLTEKTGVKYCVDHIHPLQGENVCGLHVPWNLQVLTDAENTSKGNKLNHSLSSSNP